MQTPYLTVIIPTYNSEKYIENLIQCLNNQTFQCFSILIVDDNSTDGTISLLKKYETNDARLKVIALTENHGVSYCRNVGIEHVKTPYLTFIDHDDWIDLNTFEKCSQYFNKNVDVINYGLSYDYIDFLLTEKKYIYNNNFCLSGDYALKIYGHTIHDEVKITPIVNNKLYRSAFLKQHNILFNEATRYQEDDIFTFKALLFAKKVAFVSECYYHYFQNPESAIHQVSETSINHFVISYKSLLTHLKDLSLFEKYKNEFYLKFKASLIGVIRRTVTFGKDLKQNYQLLASLYRQLYENFDIGEFLFYCNLHKI
ncbi:MAG: glycosyltransferase family 2 protein [Clostridia bacterium]|nr:glycosyltransferase family 2 protein [Clostridia bacterium]